MKRTNLTTVLIIVLVIQLCGCAPLRRPIDSRFGFSAGLKVTETNIRNEDWDRALSSLDDSLATWKRIKPYLQLDIDHDYINDIEAGFVLLLRGTWNAVRNPIPLRSYCLSRIFGKTSGQCKIIGIL